MTPQTPRAALSDADIERVAFQSWAAKAAPFINDKRDRDDSGGNLAAAVAWLAWQAAADRRLTAEQGGAASDRKLFEALSKYIHCVLQELQFERGTGSLAAHNLRLCLIEVDKALRGERDSAMNVGVGFPLEGVVAALTTQPQTIIDPAVIAPRECSITEGPRDRDRQAAQPQAEPAETFARLCEGEGTNPRWSEQQKAVATHLAALIRRATPTAQPQAAEPADPRGTHAEKYFTDEGISRIADLAALKAPEAPATIDTGDHVRHEPSGEEWLVAYVRGDRLVCCGWPESMAALSDCTLVKKATRSDRRALLGQMVGIGGSRDAYAREALKAEPEAVKFVREPRYIVIKIKDLFAYGANEDVHALQVIGDTIAGGRAADGKPPFNAVVVEQDWPEFEPTWAAIEARMTA